MSEHIPPHERLSVLPFETTPQRGDQLSTVSCRAFLYQVVDSCWSKGRRWGERCGVGGQQSWMTALQRKEHKLIGCGGYLLPGWRHGIHGSALHNQPEHQREDAIAHEDTRLRSGHWCFLHFLEP